MGEGRRSGIIIGVNRAPLAPNLATLTAPEQAARDLADVLRSTASQFAIPDANLLLGEQATVPAIKGTIRAALRSLAADDVLLISFCGHGVPLQLPPHGRDVFLATADYDPVEVADDPEAGLSMRWLRDRVLLRAGPGQIVLLLDCCHAGFIGESAEHPRVADLQAEIAALLNIQKTMTPTASAPATTRVAIAATLPFRQASAKLKQTVFSKALLQSLRGMGGARREDGTVTINSLYDALKKALGGEQYCGQYGYQYTSVVLAQWEAPGPAAVKEHQDQERQRQHDRERQIIEQAARHAESARLLQLRLAGFVGREAERTTMRAHIAAMRPTGGYVLIKALAGEGKSSIIAKLIAEAGVTTTPHHMIPLTPGPQHQLAILRTLVAQLIEKHGLSAAYFPEESYVSMKELFAAILEQLSAGAMPETLYLDGLDQLEVDHQGLRDLSFLPPQPPPGVVIVLGSRPDETLRPLDPLHKTVYDLPPLSRDDFQAVLQNRQVPLRTQDATHIYTALSGNALYLTLATAVVQRLPDADWRTFLKNIAADPDSLFRLTLDRIKVADRVAWERVIKPILAVLVVTQEPLTAAMLRTMLKVDHEALVSGLERLGGLVARSTDGLYTLYHLKFREYLIEPQPAESSRPFLFPADELQDWHQHLAAWCMPLLQDEATLWQGTMGSEEERRQYARYHAITHLALGNQWDRLCQIINDGMYGWHKRQFDPSTHLYAQDLERARESAIDRQDLASLWRWSLLRASLTSRIDGWPNELFSTLSAFGHTSEAVSRVELVSDPVRRIRLLILIAGQMDITDAHRIWQRARATADAIPNGTRRSHALQEMVVALIRAGDLAQARAIADSIVDDDVRFDALNELVVALITAGDLVQACVTADTILDDAKRSGALAHLAQALSRAEHPAAVATFDQARAIADAISDDDERSSALSKLVKALIMVDDLAQARATADVIVNDDERSSALSELVEALIREGNFAQARATAAAIPNETARSGALQELVVALIMGDDLAQARATADAIPNDDERSSALQELVVALIRAGDLAQARVTADAIPNDAWRLGALAHLAQVLSRAEHAAATVSLAAIHANANAISNDYRRSLALQRLVVALLREGDFVQARTTADAIPGEDERSSALKELVVTLIRAGDLAQAHSSADAIPREYERSSALKELIVALLREGDFVQARAVADAIPGEDERSSALQKLVNALIREGDFAQARATADAIPNGTRRSRALAYLAQVLLGAEHPTATVTLAAARAAADSIPNDNGRFHALTQLAQVLSRDQHPAATASFDQARAFADAISDDDERSRALQRLVSVLITVGYLAQAHATANAIPNYYVRSRALTRLAQALLRAEHPAAAATFDQARWTAEAIPEVVGRSRALQVLVAALIRVGDFAQARATADAISEDDRRSSALDELVAALIKAGDFAQARATADAISEDDRRSYALEKLVNALIREGDFTQARATADAIPNDTRRSGALAHVASALWRTKHPAATVTFAAARATADAIPNDDGRFHALIQLVQVLSRDQHPAATATFDEARAIADAISDDDERSSALQRMVSALITVGDLAQARATAETIPDDDGRFNALNELVVALIMADDLAQARATADAISDDDERSSALNELVKGLIMADDLAQARATADAIVINDRRWRALDELVVALIRAGDFAQARATADTISNESARSGALQKLVVALIMKDDLAQARATADAIPNYTLQSHSLKDLVVALIRAGDFAQARTTADALVDDDVRFEALEALVDALMTAGNQRMALRVVCDSWRISTILPTLLAAMRIAFPLVKNMPGLGSALFESFAWVNDQLHA
jgi:tetratricopeptide (TPR) repeat protein